MSNDRPPQPGGKRHSIGIESVVVGIDGSETSLHAVAFAIGIAVREGAHINACLVTHQAAIFPAGAVPVDFDPYVKELEKVVNEELELAGAGGSFFHREGDPVTELERLADERLADVIIVGRSRHPHLHLGSVPRRLLDISGHAVLVVP